MSDQWLSLLCPTRYGALLHILAFTPLRRHSRQQQEDAERQRVLEALHPDPDYDDPDPKAPDQCSTVYAPARLLGGNEAQPSAGWSVSGDGGERGEGRGERGEGRGEYGEGRGEYREGRGEYREGRGEFGEGEGLAAGPPGHHTRRHGPEGWSGPEEQQDSLEASRWHRYRKRNERGVSPHRPPHSLQPHGLSSRRGDKRPVDLYDTFRFNTLKHRRSLQQPPL